MARHLSKEEYERTVYYCVDAIRDLEDETCRRLNALEKIDVDLIDRFIEILKKFCDIVYAMYCYICEYMKIKPPNYVAVKFKPDSEFFGFFEYTWDRIILNLKPRDIGRYIITILHELKHHIQYVTNPKKFIEEVKRYAKLNIDYRDREIERDAKEEARKELFNVMREIERKENFDFLEFYIDEIYDKASNIATMLYNNKDMLTKEARYRFINELMMSAITNA